MATAVDRTARGPAPGDPTPHPSWQVATHNAWVARKLGNIAFLRDAAGSKGEAMAYRKAAGLVAAQLTKVSSGAGMRHLNGIGAQMAKQIDTILRGEQFLPHGHAVVPTEGPPADGPPAAPAQLLAPRLPKPSPPGDPILPAHVPDGGRLMGEYA